MGVSYSTYFGPYVKCKPIEDTFEKCEKYCKNLVCKVVNRIHPQDANFCSVCGKELSVIKTNIKQRKYNYYDLTHLIEDRLSVIDKTDFIYWIPNRKSNFTRHWDSKESLVFPVTVSYIQDDSEEFLKNYLEDIKFIRDHYPDNEFSYGVIQHSC